MNTSMKPKVFISYTWRPDDPKDHSDKPKERVLKLADRLRAAGFDCRIDQYFLNARHGFVSPQGKPGDKVEPWVLWAKEEIQNADFVLLVCSAQYAATVCTSPLGDNLRWDTWNALPQELKYSLHNFQMDESTEKKKKIPYTWWDWHYMVEQSKNRPQIVQNYIPVGFGPYASHSHYIPSFIKGKSYYNVDSVVEFDALLRSIRPRSGVFISYSHKDEMWHNALLKHLAFLEQNGVAIWTDRNILPGDQWREEIKYALATALVAVLLVTPTFLESSFIQKHELPPLLRAAESEGLIIFWIPIVASSIEQYELFKFQAAHAPSEPLAGLKGDKREQAFVKIAAKLANAVGFRKNSKK
jgi:hypothetical protein